MSFISPSQVSDPLLLTAHVARGCYPSGLAPYVPSSRPGIVSARPRPAHDFWGPNTEASPYPSAQGFRRFGIVFGKDYWQALWRLSWLSFSPSGFVARSPGTVRCPVPPVARRELPTPAELCEPRGPITPRAGFSPALRYHGPLPPEGGSGVCPCRPYSLPSDRRLRLFPSPTT